VNAGSTLGYRELVGHFVFICPMLCAFSQFRDELQKNPGLMHSLRAGSQAKSDRKRRRMPKSSKLKRRNLLVLLSTAIA
jgi:hypothetical protein